MAERIYIVDDHAVVRRGLRQLFEQEPGITVCGDTDNVADILSAIPRVEPDLVICDITLQGYTGLELTRQLAVHHPDVPVLIISMHEEELYARRALDAGARGYVMKSSSDDEVIRAARTVLSGEIYLSPRLREVVDVGAAQERLPERSPLDMLTDRELEVFLLLGQGMQPRQIADRLCLSVSTVESYRERLKNKLEIESSPLLLQYAVRWCRDNNVP